jgi:hypothetical protein
MAGCDILPWVSIRMLTKSIAVLSLLGASALMGAAPNLDIY